MRYFLCLLLLLPVLSSNIVMAEEKSADNFANNLKIGYVNIRKILSQAPQLNQIQQNLSDEFEPNRKAIIALRNEITHLTNNYDRISNNATKDKTLATIQKQLNEKQQKLNQLQQQLHDDYSLRRNEALGKLQTLIVNTVARVSKEKQLDIVFNNTGVIYMNSRVDITPDVLKSLSEQPLD